MLTASPVPAADACPSRDHVERDDDVPLDSDSSSSVGDVELPRPHINQQRVPDYVPIKLELSPIDQQVSMMRVRAGVGV